MLDFAVSFVTKLELNYFMQASSEVFKYLWLLTTNANKTQKGFQQNNFGLASTLAMQRLFKPQNIFQLTTY